MKSTDISMAGSVHTRALGMSVWRLMAPCRKHDSSVDALAADQLPLWPSKTCNPQAHFLFE